VYPTQYSKIVIEVKYCACPTSELNGWVIFVGKKSNYGLSQNCLRERRTLGMFFFSTFLLLSQKTQKQSNENDTYEGRTEW
jgi:hypothetical protein